MSQPDSPRALLVSVGGSRNPILTSIADSRPEHVWYVCSEKSRDEAMQIQNEITDPRARIERKMPTPEKKREAEEEAVKILGRMRSCPDFKIPFPSLIVLKHFEELGPCYAELRRKIPRLLAEHAIGPSEVQVDYTGGTKTMSAALVLASVERFERFSYVGGSERDKGGVGDVIDGKAKMIDQPNPWSALAVREIERARDLWEATHFDAAADTLEAAAGKVPQKILFLTVGNLARGLAARHRLHFKDAQTFFGEAARVLPSLLDGRGLDHQLTTFARQSAQLCGALKGESPDRLLLLNELLDNTLRTAAQNRFEDAAARLYRCMEMRLQIWLEEKTNGLFTNGVCPSQKIPPSWPTGLEPLGSLARHPEWGGIQLPLREIIKTLHSLHDERVAAMMEDYALCKSSRIQNVARLRNQGILAHGTSAVGAEGFEEFKTVASEFFGFDLSRERNPIPSLDPRWLQADIPDFPNPAGGV